MQRVSVLHTFKGWEFHWNDVLLTTAECADAITMQEHASSGDLRTYNLVQGMTCGAGMQVWAENAMLLKAASARPQL